MARLNIEEDAWAKIYQASVIMNKPAREVAGILSLLWHNSQSVFKQYGSKKEIIEWCLLNHDSEELQNFWINNFIKLGFISSQKKDKFRIKGNEKQINNIKSHMIKVGKAAESKKKKKHPQVHPQDHLGDQKNSSPSAYNTIQYNSVQSNTIHKEEIHNTNIVPTSVPSVAPRVSTNLIKVNSPKELAELIPESFQNNLIQIYNDQDFIKKELFKIHNWLLSNPQKNKKSVKGWCQFVSGWLERSWPKHQQGINSNPAKKTSVEELKDIMGWHD